MSDTARAHEKSFRLVASKCMKIHNNAARCGEKKGYRNTRFIMTDARKVELG